MTPRTDPETERTVIHLYVSERRSLAEVGRLVDLNQETIRQILIRNRVPRRPQRTYNTARLCANCDRPAEVGALRCKKHRDFQRKLSVADANRAYHKRLLLEGGSIE